jgi:hypothetical protein
LLLVNFRYVPATPLSSAVGTARALADTRLITIEGCGHRFFNGSRSTCAQKYEVNYLLERKLPPAGTTAKPIQHPSDKPPMHGGRLPLRAICGSQGGATRDACASSNPGAGRLMTERLLLPRSVSAGYGLRGGRSLSGSMLARGTRRQAKSVTRLAYASYNLAHALESMSG